MLWFVGTVTIDVFGPLDMTWESGMAPFPAVFALGDSQVHVGSSDRSDVIAHVEASVDK